MSRRLALALGLLLMATAAGALRWPQLSVRVLHTDEAVQGTKLLELVERGHYRYDPHEFHGPTLPYLAAAVWKLQRLAGATDLDDAALRRTTVIFGLGLVLLLWLLRDALGTAGTLAAAALTAVSPAFVFYSRYFIHETLLVLFTLAVLGCAWRYLKTQHPGWALATGAALGLVHATKETSVLTFAALAGAAGLGWVYERRFLPAADRLPWRANLRHLLGAGLTAIAVAALFFTSFGQNPRGLLDSCLTYLPWLGRAGGASPHIHPWHFYFERLLWFQQGRGPVWTEAFILVLALIGFGAALIPGQPPTAAVRGLRFLGFYTFLLTGIYTAISYKTPWCLLGFWQGTILLAGAGAAALVRWVRPRWGKVAVAGLLLAGTVQLGWQAWRTGVRYAEDQRNPYVYAQTVSDVLNLIELVEGLASVHPEGRQMVVQVMAPGADYWPLPWYLRSFGRVGWYSDVPVAVEVVAPVLIVSRRLQSALGEQPPQRMVGYFGLRPKVFLALYVQPELWQRYLARSPAGPD